MVQKTFIADPYWFRVSEFRQRNIIRRTSRTEDLPAIPTMMSTFHDRKIRTATHAFRRLDVRYPDRRPFDLLRRIPSLTVHSALARSVPRLFARVIRVFRFAVLFVMVAVDVEIYVRIEQGLLS